MIKSERLLLRKIRQTDKADVFKGLSDPRVIQYYGVSFSTPEATQTQMDWFKELEEKRKGQWWAVCSLDGTTFFGAGGLNAWDHEHRKAEIGFWLLPEYWGKGYMTEAMPLICNYAFKQMDIHRIEGYVESENRNCKNALNKLGFVLEGTCRDYEWKNGTFINIDIYSLLSSDSPTRVLTEK